MKKRDETLALIKKTLNVKSAFSYRKMPSMSRRQFVRDALLSSSLIALVGCGGSSSESISVPPISSQGTPGELTPDRPIQSIVIVGAGISGLIAGYELFRAGHQVTLLEARERNGGRVHTLTTPFSNGQFAEAGASRIPSDHNLTHAYCDHFDLARDPFYPSSSRYFNIVSNNATFIGASEYIQNPPWLGSVPRSAFSKIRGGMSSLPNAVSSAIANNINYAQIVESIIQDDNGVSVVTEDGTTYQADRVLCTVPLPVLLNIDFSPALSQQKINASNGGYHYTDSSRLFSQFDSRFWNDSDLNGWGNSDFPEEIWQPTWDDPASSGIIQSYLRGTQAALFDQQLLDQQIEQVHARFRIAMPPIDNFASVTHIHSWANEIWTGSAYASPTNEQDSQLSAHIGLAEGRVHFCGEHASNFHGWIQGALESGIRAATEIHTNA
jgi:monoamine oxidase